MTKKSKNLDEVMHIVINETHHIEVSVDGQALPLKIGDKINIGDGIVRTVMKMQINEDSGVTFGLQWIDGIDFKLEWFTYQELCYMSSLLNNKPTAKYLSD